MFEFHISHPGAPPGNFAAKAYHKKRVLVFLSALLILNTGFGCKVKQDVLHPPGDRLHGAKWITDGESLPDADSLFYGDLPAPLFRKEFNVEGPVKKATLSITACGYYHATLNGGQIGENFLDPAWTKYDTRIYYSEFDLTAVLKNGANCLGVTLGNGFYNPLPMKMWGRYNLRETLPTGKPAFIASLRIDYRNGKTENIVSGTNWKHSFGPVVRNSVYLGEVYDAGREIRNWDTPGFDDVIWQESVETEGPGGRLIKSFFPAIQVTDSIKPVRVSSPSEGVFIADLGVNFTGVYRIKLTGRPGDTVRFRFGERVYENGELNPMTAVCGQIKRGQGGPGAPQIAWQTDSFIFGNDTVAWYTPRFTYHIFRYMEITGLSEKPDELTGIAFSTRVENRNMFLCSSELLNKIQEATVRTFKDNLIGVQSDCPGREKFGYGGDLTASAESFICNFDMQSFYRKTIYDWVDAINDRGFIDTAPFVGIRSCGISWESGFLIAQDNLLLYYNDREIVKELYPFNLSWMEKAARIHPSGIVHKGLADHESLVNVPVELTGTAHYMQCAAIMEKFAKLMKDRENETKYAKLRMDLQDTLLERFWRKPVPGPINKQTLFSTLLWFDVIPENEKKACVDSLLNALRESPAGHFTTGIFGTKYILEALSENGQAAKVFSIVNSREFPGWGYMIDRGATTIWETWRESDNVFSNCHPMFGTVSEWFYRWLGGIRPDPVYPGFKRFTIAPVLPVGLDSVNCTYVSPYGAIVSKWWNHGQESQEYEITVPPETTASAVLPVRNNQAIQIIGPRGNRAATAEKVDEVHSRIRLKPGTYRITVRRSGS